MSGVAGEEGKEKGRGKEDKTISGKLASYELLKNTEPRAVESTYLLRRGAASFSESISPEENVPTRR